jgi:acyl-coenzyme A thioesterase PaaI-like protein
MPPDPGAASGAEAHLLHFTKPMKSGEALAKGRWISGRRRVFVAEARIVDSSGEECDRGTGTFLRSHIALASLAGYQAP